MSHHDVAQLYHLTTIPTKINFLHLKVSDIQPRQDFTHCPPGQLDAMVKTIPTQLWMYEDQESFRTVQIANLNI